MAVLSAAEESFPRIPGYEVLSPLGEGAVSVVYRARRQGRHYALKVMKSSNADAGGSMLRFRREAAAVARLLHPSLARVAEVGEAGGRPYLAMDLVEGENLLQRLAKGPLDQAAVVAIGMQLASALSEVHRHGLVHRDIKPDNVVVGPSGKACLIDFGFATAIETGQPASDSVAGTLLYAAPEQLGLLSRPLDGRADLYALGATLFHCACGRAPFQTADVAELLHHLAAVQPPSASALRAELSPTLSRILAKLLAKDPDDRYQTAEGLRADLEVLEELDGQTQAGQLPALGGRDRHFRHRSDVPLIGRKTELAALEERWEAARADHGSTVQVEGESGSGKSRLVRELRRRAESEAWVIHAKCQLGDAVPLGPIREAIEEHLAALNRLPEADRQAAVNELREASRENATVLARLSPALASLLGLGEDVAASQVHEKEVFYARVADFFIGLARRRGALFLHVDDIQWIDEGSLELVRQLAARAPELPILILTTARTDAASAEATRRFVDLLGDKLSRRIALGPLSDEAVRELVLAHLGGRGVDEQVLRQVTQLANGNPWALGEYVRLLLDRGLLEPRGDHWVADGRLSDVALPRDMVSLVVSRLDRLGAEARAVVGAASLIGHHFPVALLARGTGKSAERVGRALQEALAANLVEQLDGGEYAFVHDRVQEAAAERLAPADRARVHEALALQLDAIAHPSPAQVHAAAKHYAACALPAHARRLAETSLLAGQYALEAYSNQDAFELLTRAQAAAAQSPGSNAETLKLATALGLACTRTARFEEAYRQFQRALSVATDEVARAEIQYLIALALVSEGKEKQSWVELTKAFSMIGRPLPKGGFSLTLSILWNLFWAVVLGVTRLGYGSARGDRRARLRLLSQMQGTASIIAYMQSMVGMLVLLTLREVVSTQPLGTSSEHARARAFYGGMLALVRLNGPADRHGQAAIQMAEQLGDKGVTALCRFYYSLNLQYRGFTRKAEALSRQIKQDILTYLGSFESSLYIGDFCFQLQLRGYSREAVEVAQAMLPFNDAIRNAQQQANQRGLIFANLALTGRLPEGLTRRQEQLEIAARHPDSIWVQCGVHFTGIHALLEQGELGPELEEHIAGFLSFRIIDYHTRYTYFLIAWARYEQLRLAPAELRAAARKRLSGALMVARVLSPTPAHRCQLEAIAGGWAALEGRHAQARRRFSRAEALAREADSAWGQFMVARERARLAAAEGDEITRRGALIVAHELAHRLGWVARAAQLKREFPDRRAEASAADTLVGSAADSMRTSTLNTERHMHMLLEVSRASANSLDLHAQARAALDELVRVLGAERAFMFLCDAKGELVLQGGRDASGNELTELKGYSSTVVQKVAKTREPLVVAGTEEGALLGSESAVAHNLRSIVAAPMMFQDELLGVVYLDNRLAKGVFTQEITQLLSAIAGQLAVAVRTGRMAQVEAERRALEKDIALTAAVQALLLPKADEVEAGPVRLAAYYQPAEQCGGDWWWQESLPDGRHLVVVGDVTGHGAASSMVTATVAASFQTIRMLLAASPEGGDIARLLGLMNDSFQRTTGSAYFMTLSAVVIDPTRERISWFNAGAPPVFFARPGEKWGLLHSQGTPFGDTPFSVAVVEEPFPAGSRALVFTDGAFELARPSARPLGLNGLKRILAETGALPLTGARAHLVQKLRAIQGDTAPEDDITLVLVELGGQAAAVLP
jgi:serine phosphatase RsbU (regulator of sigma subunit)/tRNA A-37 threonylcarbamoyl transferase component Bud32/tetratricopeptide (TPR) repeat protein